MRFAFSMLIVMVLGLSQIPNADAASRSRSRVRARRAGPMVRLVELERRKNAWLRRTLLGR